eukprot:m.45131 g.45131  ORF g.45131 m.45131 type:complete len:78 (+) comp19881_c0_seq1:65-298(+)
MLSSPAKNMLVKGDHQQDKTEEGREKLVSDEYRNRKTHETIETKSRLMTQKPHCAKQPKYFRPMFAHKKSLKKINSF